MRKSINISLSEEDVSALKEVANLLLDIKEEVDKAKENNFGFYVDGIDQETLVKILTATSTAATAIMEAGN